MTAPPAESWRPAMFLLPASLFVLFLFLAPFFFPATVLQEWWWAGLHLWRFPVVPQAWQFLAPLVPVMVLLMPARAFDRMLAWLRNVHQRLSIYTPPMPVLFIASFVVCWIFRPTSLIFGDSVFYVTDLIPGQALSERGITINFDSIGVTMLYSLGYRHASGLFAMDVLSWYNLVGLLSFFAFLWWAYKNRGRKYALGGGLALAIMLLGNWSQAAMGAPEHYGQLLLCSLAFAILAVESLAGREPLWKACLAYSIGAFFHLGIAWLFPSLVYLVLRKWREETIQDRWYAVFAMVIPALLTGGLVYHFGYEVSFLGDSHAARGKIIPFMNPMDPHSGDKYQYATLDPRHLAHVLQELLLMGWPGVILTLGTLPYIRRAKALVDRRSMFLLVYLGGAVAFNLLWNPDLEFWRDQDLFSMIGLAVCLYGVWLILGPASSAIPADIRTRLIVAAIAGGIAWRLPVILYHGVLAMNYSDPLNFGAWWPFPDGPM